MMVFTSFLFAYIAFLLIATTQKRPRKFLFQVSEISPGLRKLNRSFAAMLLLISLALTLGSEGWSFGSIVWCCLISIAAIAVSLNLTWGTDLLRRLFSAIPIVK